VSTRGPTPTEPAENAERRVSEGLALGTAQLGMRYGILETEPPADHEVVRLLETAWQAGVRYFDTAQAYGGSEQLLGARLPPDRFPEALIITKLHPDAEQESKDTIERRLKLSRARLGERPVWAVLLHRDRMLERWSSDLGKVLRRWRSDGLIRFLGASVESMENLSAVLAADDLNVIQVPASVFDRRLLESGLWERARDAGKRVFARGVYFQGLAVADVGEVRARAPMAAGMVEAYARFCELHGLDRRRFAVDYARHRLPGAILVIGAETTAQVSENCGLVAGPECDPWLCDAWDEAWQPSESVVDLPQLTRLASRTRQMRIPVVIQARMGSSRLPGKSLMMLGDRPVLQWVVDRARQIPGTSGVVVATSREHRDDPIASYCKRYGLPVFRGSESDVLDRFAACAREQHADAAVRITGDCPLLDPAESGRVVAAFKQTKNCDYASNISPRIVPDGLDTEVISRAALETAWREATDPADREHVTLFVRRQPERFVSVSVNGTPVASVGRLTLDTLADFTVLSGIVERLRARGVAGSLSEMLAILDEPEMAELIGASG
jgi:spore coat polysaccharide biosynthesis protein SpsF (cytidylyltransferase family)/aryl-alcohol dehydrogenase-like predicted oxidoreductase